MPKVHESIVGKHTFVKIVSDEDRCPFCEKGAKLYREDVLEPYSCACTCHKTDKSEQITITISIEDAKWYRDHWVEKKDMLPKVHKWDKLMMSIVEELEKKIND